MITEGDIAPSFTADATTMDGTTTVDLSTFRGRTLVLYFYPKDETPGCTKEACSIRDFHDQIIQLNSVIVGVSPDDARSHVKFANNHLLPFMLLSDPDHAIAMLYDAWGEKKNYGKTYMGVERRTVVIDSNGVIKKIFPRVKVEGHVDKILDYIEGM